MSTAGLEPSTPTPAPVTPTLGAALHLVGPESAALRSLEDPLLATAPADLLTVAQAFGRARRELRAGVSAGPSQADVWALADVIAGHWIDDRPLPADLREQAAAAAAAEQARAAHLRALILAAGTLRDQAQDQLHEHAPGVIRGPLGAELDRIRTAYKAASAAVDGRDLQDSAAFVNAPPVAREAYFTVRELATAYTRLKELHRVWLALEADGSTSLQLHLDAHHDEMEPTGPINLPSDPLARFLLIMRNPWMPSLAEMEDARSTLNPYLRPKPAPERVESA